MKTKHVTNRTISNRRPILPFTKKKCFVITATTRLQATVTFSGMIILTASNATKMYLLTTATSVEKSLALIQRYSKLKARPLLQTTFINPNPGITLHCQ